MQHSKKKEKSNLQEKKNWGKKREGGGKINSKNYTYVQMEWNMTVSLQTLTAL